MPKLDVNSNLYMMIFRWIWILAVCLAGLISCTNEASTADTLSASYHDMQRIDSQGDSVQITAANITSRFSYNFYIDVHEVTVGEYAQVLNASFDSDEKDYPVTDVSFYDAVFFANEKSKAMELDTVYSYEGLSRSSDGHIIFLEKFTTDFQANGYRLPTEAEWIYAAQNGWNPSKNAWTSENSDFEKHKVCELPKDKNGLCDMAGNVLEWTNDWLSSAKDISVENFAGASHANSLSEVVVKGGSYRNAAANIQLKNRGDVYTVSPAMHAAYVGFRLVRGIVDFIQQPEEGGGLAWEWNVQVQTSASEIKKKLGALNSVLAFRDDETGNLGYIRFASSNPTVVEIVDTLDVYHPVISPDGSKIAFCTKPEGISGNSSLYVRDLNETGTNLVKLDVESAAIPRWRVLGADTQIVYVTSAANNANDVEWKQASTWSVPFANGTFGTPTKILEGSYNGGVLNDGTLAVSGARLLRAKVNGREEVWLDGEQACNVSLSEVSRQVLFLDFGSSTGEAFSGEAYLPHQKLLVSDARGNLTAMIPAPEHYTFDHTEWVENSPDYAVATLTDNDGAHSKIVLIRTMDSSVMEIASGNELWHPNLWIDAMEANQQIDLDMDSAGVYVFQGDEYVYQLLRVKMELFWNRADSLEVVCLGSSRVEDGIIAQKLDSSYAAVNLGHPGNTLSFTLFIAENYVLNHAHKLKALVIALDIDIWQAYENAYFNQFQKYPGTVYDRNHHYWKNGTPSYFPQMVQSSYAEPNIRNTYLNTLGFNALEPQGWGEVSEVNVDSMWASIHPEIIDAQWLLLENFLTLTKARGISVVGIIFPQSPLYKKTGSFGRYGPQRSVAVSIIEGLNALQKKYPNFVLMDENKMGDHDYSDAMAYGVDHLATPGAERLTDRLDSVLRTLETFQ